MDGLTAGGELSAGGATFRPSALQTLSHFPIAIAAHMEGGELVVLIEAIDGALGVIPAATLGQRVLTTAERLMQDWDRPLRDVSVLLDDEAGSLRAADTPKPLSPLSIHARFADVAARAPDNPAVSWAGGALSYRELDLSSHPAGGAPAPKGSHDRNTGGYQAFPGTAIRHRDTRRAESRRHVRADGAGNAPRTGELDSAPIGRTHRVGRRAHPKANGCW